VILHKLFQGHSLDCVDLILRGWVFETRRLSCGGCCLYYLNLNQTPHISFPDGVDQSMTLGGDTLEETREKLPGHPRLNEEPSF